MIPLMCRSFQSLFPPLASVSLFGAGALALLGNCCLPAAQAEPAAGYRIAILDDRIEGFERGQARRLAESLRREGFPVATLSCRDLADPAVFHAGQFDCLVLADSPRFPAVAWDNLNTFIGAGGDLALLGGHAFSRPVFANADGWLTAEEFARQTGERLMSGEREAPALFRVREAPPDTWSRAASRPAAPSRILHETDGEREHLLLDLRDMRRWAWDLFERDVAPLGDGPFNALGFWAKGDDRTGIASVSVLTRDRETWTAAVPLGLDWAYRIVPASTFVRKEQKDGEAAGLDLSRVATIRIGLAPEASGPNLGERHTLRFGDMVALACPEDLAQTLAPLPFLLGFDDYEFNRLDGAERVAAVSADHALAPPFAYQGPVRGTAAIGYSLPGQSAYLPLLEATDRHGRRRGFAAGALVHFDGPRKNSQIALFGVEDAAFQTEVHERYLPALLAAFATGTWTTRAEEAQRTALERRLERTAPPLPRLTLRDGHFVDPEGRRFFMVGANFYNSFDRHFGGDAHWDMDELERLFERMERAGINALRIQGFGRISSKPERLEPFLELCRRHGVYILPAINVGKEPFLKQGREAMQEEARRTARLLKDENAVLGYDLQNEPYWWELGNARDGEQTLRQRFPVDGEAWKRYEATLGLEVSGWTSTFPGLQGPLAEPEDPAMRQAWENVNRIVGTWIGWQIEAIREIDPERPITVGYNCLDGCLPANAVLDFISHHIYEPPTSLRNVLRNVTTLDRLRNVWPGKSVSLGEFGYSTGDYLVGRIPDAHSQAVGEMIHFLYALAHGYDGAMKWQLCDAHPLFPETQRAWLGDKTPAERARELRFGFFYPDGSPAGGAKPIAHATRFLRDYVDAGNFGGELTIREGDTFHGAAYTYRGDRALFVGDRAHESPELRFAADVPVNVMLWADGDEVRIVSSADTRVSIRPAAFLTQRPAGPYQTTGFTAGTEQAGEWLAIELLAGERATVR